MVTGIPGRPWNTSVAARGLYRDDFGWARLIIDELQHLSHAMVDESNSKGP